MGGLAGVAGMAQGLKGNIQNTTAGNDLNSNKSHDNSSINDEKRNPNSSNKEGANSQELNKNNAMSAATSEPTQDTFDPKTNEESPSGPGSSLEEEMQNESQKQGEKHSANAQNYQGLHEEIGSKSGALKTRSNVSRMNDSNRLQPTSSKKDDRPSDQKQKDYPRITSVESSGRTDQNNAPVNKYNTPEQSDLAVEAQNIGNNQQYSGSSNLSKPVLQEKVKRHIGQVVSDNFHSKPSVKSVKKTYEIGRNTGESLKKNIANYRDKYRSNSG